jgi:hypothetical protein
MNNLNLVQTHRTSTGSQHIQVVLNGKDVGILYLTEDETKLFLKLFRVGAVTADIMLATDLYTENSSTDDDIFDYND